MTTDERFWEKVKKNPERSRNVSSCWDWIGGNTGRGSYGRFALTSTRADVQLILPHRYSWELHYGAIPVGLVVLHACDNGACVRPEHLMLGSRMANQVDASRKGRLCRSRRPLTIPV